MKSIGQSKEDSVKISKKARNNMYARALQADALDSLLDLSRREIVLLENKVMELIEQGDTTAASYEREIVQWKGKEQILLKKIEEKDKEIRREKRKRKWATFGGIITTGAVIYLSTLK